MHLNTFAPWRIKTVWVKPLFQRAVTIRSHEVSLNQQIKKIWSFVSWNGFPNYIWKALLHRLKSSGRNRSNNTSKNNVKDKNVRDIVFRLPYAGTKGEQLVKHCLKEIRRCLKIYFKFIVIMTLRNFRFTVM